MIPQLIFDWAKRTPDKTAVIYNGRPWSYRSFAEFIAVARGYFAQRGYVGPGYAVLAVRNLMWFWIVSLALRSLGLTTVVVRSAAEVATLGLPNVRCVVTNSDEAFTGLDSLCTELGLPLLSVSLAGEAALALEASEAPHPSGGHILLTSGTTGTNKMLLMSPAFDSFFLWHNVDVIGLNQDTVLIVFDFPASTEIGYKWAASPWAVGGAVVIEQGRELYQALLCPGITHAVLVPAMLASILAAPADAFPRNDTMQLIVGGGALTRSQVEQVKARITPRLFSWLGSTEAGGIAYTSLDTTEDLKWHRLLPGCVVEIVDESGRPLPTGKIGRVRVGTVGGPTGYHHNEAATRACFEDGFFYPGDLAVIRSDGRLALQGRLTDVINVQGVKIFPTPIEDRLAELLGVSGVCLFSMPNDSGEEEIHVVVETPTPIDSERLIAALNQELEGFHQGYVHRVAALPRNQTGKVSRREVQAQVIASRAPSARMD